MAELDTTGWYTQLSQPPISWKIHHSRAVGRRVASGEHMSSSSPVLLGSRTMDGQLYHRYQDGTWCWSDGGSIVPADSMLYEALECLLVSDHGW